MAEETGEFAEDIVLGSVCRRRSGCGRRLRPIPTALAVDLRRQASSGWHRFRVWRAAARQYGAPLSILPLVASVLMISACEYPGESIIGTNTPLRPAPDLAGAATPGVVIWRSPDLAEQERRVTTYFIPPATIYRGKGSSFADLTPQEIDDLAADVTRNVRAAIGRRYKLASGPGPEVFELDLSLVKIDPPRPVYFSNGPYDWSSSVIGMPEAQTMTAGVMTIAGKFIDGATGKLLVGFIAPVSPERIDLSTGHGPGESRRFGKAASQQFASDLVAAIVRQRQIGEQTAPR